MSVGVAVKLSRNELTLLAEVLAEVAGDNPHHEDTPRLLTAYAKLGRALTKVEAKMARRTPPP